MPKEVLTKVCMLLQQRISAFEKLGAFLKSFFENLNRDSRTIDSNNPRFEGLKQQITLAQEHNGWFTGENIRFALNHWASLLTPSNIQTWLAPYSLDCVVPKRIAVVTAGNIPLVGWHDVLSVLISGHYLLVKQSSNDVHLLPFLIKYLEYVEPKFKGYTSFTCGKIESFDAVIATGSNNSARYFEYYFRKKPSIIRKHRNSIAVLNGNETTEDLKLLSDDIFRYYGLGCRNVSKLFVPKEYDFNKIFEALYHWYPVIDNTKYANNYNYNKAIYLMGADRFFENGFLMIREANHYASPIATLFYEYYDDNTLLKATINADKHLLQCVVSKGFLDGETAFGETQKPQLWDYADANDSMTFLQSIASG